MHIFLFVFLFVTAESVFFNSYKKHKKTNGHDQRFEKSDSSPLLSYTIETFFEKKKLLTALQNPDISIHTKKRLLPNTHITPTNLFAGGLLKNWSFDMEEIPPGAMPHFREP